MPAVTLQKSTIHSSQNCGVRIALLAETDAVVTMALPSASSCGSQPSGVQSSAGTLTR